MAIFCAVTVVFLVGRDLGLPEVGNVEVWLGFELRGVWAARTAPLHWALYAFAALAFARDRDWVWPASTGYAGLVAVSHLVWNLASPRGEGLLAGLVQLAIFLVPVAVISALKRSRDREQRGGASDAATD